jgi:hypothetical protein
MTLYTFFITIQKFLISFWNDYCEILNNPDYNDPSDLALAYNSYDSY